MIYSILESTKANKQHVQRYLSGLLTELPNVQTADDIESLLPWNITPDGFNLQYSTYPAL